MAAALPGPRKPLLPSRHVFSESYSKLPTSVFTHRTVSSCDLTVFSLPSSLCSHLILSLLLDAKRIRWTVLILILSLYPKDFIHRCHSRPVCVCLHSSQYKVVTTSDEGNLAWSPERAGVSRASAGLRKALPSPAVSTKCSEDLAAESKAVLWSVWGLGFGDKGLWVQILVQRSSLLEPLCPSAKWEQFLF